MAQFVTTLLAANEKVVFETQLSWFAYIPYLTCLGLELVAAIILAAAPQAPLFAVVLLFSAAAALTILLPWLERKYSEYVVTNRRVIVKTGIISRNVFEMPLAKIESVDLSQSIAGRMFDYGTLVLHGTGDTAKALKMIAQPVRFRQAITGWQ